MITHMFILLAFAFVVATVAIWNNARLNRIVVAVLVGLLMLRELGIAVYTRIVLDQATFTGEMMEAYKHGALAARDEYTFISFHLALAYVFVLAVCLRGCKSR